MRVLSDANPFKQFLGLKNYQIETNKVGLWAYTGRTGLYLVCTNPCEQGQWSS